MDGDGYSPADIEGLLTGFVEVIVPGPGPVDEPTIEELPRPSWAELRSVIEHRGQVDAEGWCEVMDAELALAKLAAKHPKAAAVAVLRMHGFEPEELPGRVLARQTNIPRLTSKAVAWLASYLSGGDEDAREAAYRRAG